MRDTLAGECSVSGRGLVTPPLENHGRAAPMDLRVPLGIGVLVFVAIVLWFQLAGFSVLRSDLEVYVNASHHPLSFRDYASHLPGYPVVLALARLGTAGVIGNAQLAQLLNLVFWAGGVLLAGRALRVLAPEARTIGLLLFAMAPLVGVMSAVDAGADLLAYLLFMGALVAALEGRSWLLTGLTAAGLLVHQAFYPFYLGLCLVCAVSGRMSWFQFILSGIPFLAYYAGGAVAHGDANWILSYHRRTHLPKGESWPVFGAVIGELSGLGAKGLIKGSLLLVIIGLAGWLGLRFTRQRNWILVSLAAPILLYGIVANETIGFILIRLSKLLVIPLCVWMSETRRLTGRLQAGWPYFGLTALLVATQFAWAAYTIEYHSSAGGE